MPITLVIADDHQLVLDGLENLFRLQEDFQLLASCTNGSEVLQAVSKHRPDVAVLDIVMPGKDGLTIAREIQTGKLPTRVVLLTAELDEDQMLEAVRSGVWGVVLKVMAPQLLVQCIRKVYAGERWIERRTAWQSLEKLLRREAGASEIASLLTPREMDVLRLTVQGLHNKQIAEKLFVGEGTIKVHLYNIFEKLHVDSRVSLMRLAQEKGLV